MKFGDREFMLTSSKDPCQFKLSVVKAFSEEIWVLLVVNKISIPVLDNSWYFINFDIFIFGNPVALNLIEVVLVIGQSRDFFEKSYKLRSIKV